MMLSLNAEYIGPLRYLKLKQPYDISITSEPGSAYCFQWLKRHWWHSQKPGQPRKMRHSLNPSYRALLRQWLHVFGLWKAPTGTEG